MKIAGFIGVVVLVWLFCATTSAYAPVPMTYLNGAVPEQKTYNKACPFDEAGMKSCVETSFYLWRLPGDGAVTTTWKPSRSDVETVTGTLVHENSACPGSRVEWSVLADERTSGTLTDDAPKTQLAIPVKRPVPHVTLTLRRLGTATCTSALRWTDPRLEVPFKLLP
ncbi:hypothetical protein [Nonomuraea rhizosphaerae]|uniref:hypothetical protein n=1 Tax=Nonomuraea rhizosphaerae TaxID=2665663 RepID=UPI001C5E6CA3|nr:hypothetical protein [Nonomuraea rhizosphaerae]